MKVWVYTANDIEDHYPEKVFSTEEKADAYYQEQLALAQREGPYFYADVVEMEVDDD